MSPGGIHRLDERTVGENLRNQLCGRQHLLEIVQDEQKRAAGLHLIGDHLRDCPIRHRLQIKGFHDGSPHQVRIGDGCQRHKLHTTRKVFSHMFRHREGEPGLGRSQYTLLHCPHSHRCSDQQRANTVPVQLDHLMKITNSQLNKVAGVLWLIQEFGIAREIVTSAQFVDAECVREKLQIGRQPFFTCLNVAIR